MLVVQVTEILWTKATRGAPRSNERVRLPRAFTIMNHEGVAYVIQYHRMAEWESFKPTLVKAETKQSVPGSEDALRISHAGVGSFLLGLQRTPNGGQPRRTAMPTAIELALDQYARITLNARHTTYSGQYYSETIYNVACGVKVAPDRFLSGPPEHEINLKAHLF